MNTKDALFAQNWIEQYRYNVMCEHRTATNVCRRYELWGNILGRIFIYAYAPEGRQVWLNRQNSDFRMLIR